MLFGDYFQSVKATLYDRVSSPLWGAFSISWVAWNHRMLIVLFSSQIPDQKFWYIGEFLYPDWEAYAIYWVGAPLLTAAIIIGAVPAVGELAYRISRFWKVRLKEAKLEYDGKTPMSQDEVNKVLIKSAEERRALEDRIAIAVKERNDVEKRLAMNMEQLSTLQSQASISESKLVDADKKIEGLKLALDLKKLTTDSDEELRQILVNYEFTLIFNAKDNRSKSITFNEDGSIGKGRNINEDRWDIDAGDLLIFTEKDELQNRFIYHSESGGFKAADDVEVKALPDQSIIPISTS